MKVEFVIRDPEGNVCTTPQEFGPNVVPDEIWQGGHPEIIVQYAWIYLIKEYPSVAEYLAHRKGFISINRSEDLPVSTLKNNCGSTEYRFEVVDSEGFPIQNATISELAGKIPPTYAQEGCMAIQNAGHLIRFNHDLRKLGTFLYKNSFFYYLKAVPVPRYDSYNLDADGCCVVNWGEVKIDISRFLECTFGDFPTGVRVDYGTELESLISFRFLVQLIIVCRKHHIEPHFFKSYFYLVPLHSTTEFPL